LFSTWYARQTSRDLPSIVIAMPSAPPDFAFPLYNAEHRKVATTLGQVA
jgi:hypothetical protein